MKWSELSERAKDRLIAEKVMSHTVRAQGTYDGGFAHVGGKPRPAYYLFMNGETDWRKECASEDEAWNLCPRYTTSMDAAWQLTERFGAAELKKWPNVRRYENTPYSCTITTHGNAFSAWGTTPQEAICFAALRAVGVEVETETAKP